MKQQNTRTLRATLMRDTSNTATAGRAGERGLWAHAPVDGGHPRSYSVHTALLTTRHPVSHHTIPHAVSPCAPTLRGQGKALCDALSLCCNKDVCTHSAALACKSACDIAVFTTQDWLRTSLQTVICHPHTSVKLQVHIHQPRHYLCSIRSVAALRCR